MMNIQLDDGRQRVYQWEIGRYIKLIGFSSCDKVFFSNPDSDEAYVVETQTSGDVIKAQIPNELLQLDNKIKVYCNGVDANGQYVQLHTIIPLEARQKPASYVYEPTEIMTFESVLEEAEKLKDETSDLRDEAQNLKNDTNELKNKADNFSKIAERYAKGTEDGVPVTSGDGFQDNAKYFKEQTEKALAEGLEAYNTNAAQKTNAFNDNAVQKTNDFNDNAANEKNAFNSNAEDKTSAFDEHVSSKHGDFDSHASSKENELESALDSHTNEKKTELNDYTSETLKNQLDEYTIQKKSDIDSHASEKVADYDENASEKTNAFDDNANIKAAALAQALDEYVAELKSSELVPLVDNATQNAGNAADSAELAEKWASNPENTVVKDGKYSAFHYAKKAEKAADDAQSIVGTSLTPDRVLVSDANGNFSVSDITTTILSYLSGLTGDVQNQLGGKLGNNEKAQSALIADKWTTARTLTIAQDGSGSVSMDGSGNMTLDLTVKRYNPPGTMLWYFGPVENMPDGYLVCNGTAYSRTAYAALFAAIGTKYGAGDGSTTFNVPDLTTGNGRYIRAGFTNNDIGRLIDDAIRNILGGFGYGGVYGLFKSDAMSGAFYSGETASRTFGEGKGSADHGKFDASRVVPTANENRPFSIYALPLIAY